MKWWLKQSKREREELWRCRTDNIHSPKPLAAKVGAARCGILIWKMLLSSRGHNLRHFSQGSNQFQFATATSCCHICNHKMEANCREKADVGGKKAKKKEGVGQVHFSYCSLPVGHNSVVVKALLLVGGEGPATICSCQ